MNFIVVTDECEHCGRMDEQPMYFDGGTYWCVWCAKAGCDADDATISEIERMLNELD